MLRRAARFHSAPLTRIQLHNNEIIPADILLLASSNPEKTCFVETANLDGESNLKQRRVFSEALEFDPATFAQPITIEPPNNRIYEFSGHVMLHGVVHPLDSSNLLLRGCVVRNTDVVTGVVCVLRLALI